MATYNGENYIKEQLDSILAQLDENDEVIVSDDHSTDKTLDIVKDFKDSRIKIYSNELGKGYSKNFENSIIHSSGDIIFLSDQDDVWMHNKVELMLKQLNSADLVISDAIVTDENLNTTIESHFRRHETKTGFIENWLKTRYIGACMAFHRRILEKVLPFPTNQKLCAHDYWIANVGEFFYKVKLEKIPLMKYRRHGSNASTGGEKSENSLIHKLKVRCYTFVKLLSRISN